MLQNVGICCIVSKKQNFVLQAVKPMLWKLQQQNNNAKKNYRQGLPVSTVTHVKLSRLLESNSFIRAEFFAREDSLLHKESILQITHQLDFAFSQGPFRVSLKKYLFEQAYPLDCSPAHRTGHSSLT